MDMLLESRAVPSFYKNGFLLGCEHTRDAVVIDPGDEIEDLLEIVRTRHLHVTSILLTHGHVDHVAGVAKAKAALDAVIYIHEEDVFLYRAAGQQAQNLGFEMDPPPRIDRFYDPQQPIPFGNYEVRVHHTPGHSPGAICLQVGPAGQPGKKLFVGDTLFAGSIGRTDLPGGSYETLMRSIRNVLFAFGDDAEVYPGHGPATTIGQERRTNPFLQG
jgi:glyoxylase-like metal-dependent hydrolase (beta-lactamase superfamily II)